MPHDVSVSSSKRISINPAQLVYVIPENALFIRLITEKELAYYGVEKTGYGVFDMNGEIEERFGTGTMTEAYLWILDMDGCPLWMH